MGRKRDTAKFFKNIRTVDRSEHGQSICHPGQPTHHLLSGEMVMGQTVIKLSSHSFFYDANIWLSAIGNPVAETVFLTNVLRGRQDKLPIPTAARAHPLRCSLGQRPLWASSLVRASRLHPWRSSLYVSYPTILSVWEELRRSITHPW